MAISVPRMRSWTVAVLLYRVWAWALQVQYLGAVFFGGEGGKVIGELKLCLLEYCSHKDLEQGWPKQYHAPKQCHA